MKVLAICGSLRQASINGMLLRAAAQLAPEGMTVCLFDHPGTLPLFNPDLNGQLPAAVTLLHREVAAADALLIASPEYAHGVTGTIKNLLDWLVSFEPMVFKPVAVLNASPRAHHADDAIRETLRTMNTQLVEAACISIPLLASGLTDATLVHDPECSGRLRHALGCLSIAVQHNQEQT